MGISRLWGLVAVLAAGVAVFGAIYFINKDSSEPRPEEAAAEWQRPAGRPPGFRERSFEAGLIFNMNLLLKEQGSDYKINPYDHGSGVAVGDYDGDGKDDIYLLNQHGENALYRNNGDGTFTDVTQQAGVGLGDRVCVAAMFVDYDNSGRQSLFVTSTRGGNVLFKNVGNGKFKDVTKEVGLQLVGHCQTAVFFDYDNDGYLDLLVTGTAEWTRAEKDPDRRYYPGLARVQDLAQSKKEKNVLYHNEPVDPKDPSKGRKFVNVTAKSGLEGKGWSADVAVLDYDEDGYMDVLITNMFGPAQLYRNNGKKGATLFTEVTKETLGRTSWGGMGCKAFDFNNDGKLDLFIVDMHSDMWLPSRDDPEMLAFARKNQRVKFKDSSGGARQFAEKIENVDEQEKQIARMFDIKYDQVLFGNTFFKNLGGGKFKEMSDRAGLETFWPWGIATGDFDNDGFEDIFVPAGMGYPFFYWPNSLLMNNGDETFTDHARGEEIEPPARGEYQDKRFGGKRAARSSRAAAVADFRGTGQLDIIVNNFNDRPYYFQNQFPRQNFIQFRLRGTKSNRDAIGAVVRLYTGKEIMTRQVHPAGGYLAQSSKTVHIGLGERTRIDRVEVRWPSGRRQKLDQADFKINKLNEIVEPAN
jgi:hypothetical protein